MNFFEAVSSTYSKYFQSSGRSPRSEYWYFFLFMLIVDTCLMTFREIGVLATGIVGLATFVPFTMLLIRRFHDIGWSGWWASYPLVGFVVTRVIPDLLPDDHPFLTFVLFLGLGMIIFFFYLMCKKGNEGENRFGPDPLDHKT